MHRGIGREAFTLIEVLIVVLVIAILCMVAIPLFMSAVDDSELKTCHANMQSIANAVQAKRVRDVAPDYSAYIAGGVGSLPDLQTVICPEGGSYSIAAGLSGNASTFKVVCSLAAHTAYEPGH